MNNIGVKIPKILLPRKSVDMSKWAVIACDQFTSQLDYWKEVEAIVADNPSTLKLIFPEVYLGKDDDSRIKSINASMQQYLDEKLFIEREGIIYVERTLNNGKLRKGLVLALDLEAYDYNKGSSTLIRATEGTIVSRLPPRIKVREDAPIELPHIMVLIDDPEKIVVEKIDKEKQALAYDFELMKNGGSIKGYLLSDEEQTRVLSSLTKLADPELFKKKYSLEKDYPVLLFAMGDGNHSLATAKAIWESNKKKGFPLDHNSRYALVELVNLYDDSLDFEPIHRVVFENEVDILKHFAEYCSAQEIDFAYRTFDSREELLTQINTKQKHGDQLIGFVRGEELGMIELSNPKNNLAVGSLQAFLDNYMKEEFAKELDYVHGEDVVSELGSKDLNAGFFLPGMSKDELFKTVILDGALPRKTFSMGHAEDKRYYVEARKIN